MEKRSTRLKSLAINNKGQNQNKVAPIGPIGPWQTYGALSVPMMIAPRP
jgi:hypothetical protein